jgi:hypothetical protein
MIDDNDYDMISSMIMILGSRALLADASFSMSSVRDDDGDDGDDDDDGGGGGDGDCGDDDDDSDDDDDGDDDDDDDDDDDNDIREQSNYCRGELLYEICVW